MKTVSLAEGLAMSTEGEKRNGRLESCIAARSFILDFTGIS